MGSDTSTLGAATATPQPEVDGVGRRPWGTYTVLDDAGSHKVKRIEVQPGQRLSYQRHRLRSEHWFVVSGEGVVVLDGVEHRVGPTRAVDVPAGTAHRIENTGSVVLVFVEVQHGTSFDEDDIERLDDDYGRAAEEPSR